MFHFKTKNEEMSEISHPLSDLLDESKDSVVDDDDFDSRSSSPIAFSPVRRRFSDKFRGITKQNSDGSGDSQSEQKTGLLQDLKGRIVKTVEDKISEYKSEKRLKSTPAKNGKELSDVTDYDGETSSIYEEMSIQNEPEPLPKDDSKSVTSSSPKESYFSSIKEKVCHLSSLEELKRRRLKLGPSAVQGLVAEEMEESPVEIETGLEADEKENDDINDFKDPVDDLEDVVDKAENDSDRCSVLVEDQIYHIETKVPPVVSETKSVIGGLVLCLTSLSQKLSQISRVTYYIVLSVVLCVLVLPTFLSGLFTGLALSVIVLVNYEPSNRKCVEQAVPTPRVEAIVEHRETECYEEWFFELPGEYDSAVFKSGMLTPVFLQLKGSILSILVPKRKFKLKRQQEFGEEVKAPTFIQRRIFDLKGAQATLLPKNLSGLRIWSKRYPISIVFPDRQSQSGEEKNISIEPEDNRSIYSKDCEEFEVIQEENYEEKSLVLFARTDRAKDKWLRLFSIASASSVDSVPTCTLDYKEYMSYILSQKHKLVDSEASHDPLLWFNALKGRILYDFLTRDRWKEYVKAKLERKLAKIKFPQFMGEVRIADINLGKTIPTILAVEDPVFDKDTGLWIDLDIEYEGGFQMAMETKLNMLKVADKECEMSEMSRRPDSFSDSGSDDEEFCDLETDTQRILEAAAEEQRTSKLSSVFDKITQSKYFQQASEHKYVRKALEGVSGLRLMLQVEVLSLKGKMIINVPPPPADRIWYGFRSPPDLNLRAVPKAGERTFSMGLITDWIEKQLISEVEKVFVYPNMDEQHILLMDANGLY